MSAQPKFNGIRDGHINIEIEGFVVEVQVRSFVWGEKLRRGGREGVRSLVVVDI